jgi:hypothetical protein
MEIDEEKNYTYNISVEVCLWFCRLDVGMQLGCIGAVGIVVTVLGFKSVEELYPSPLFGVDSADTSKGEEIAKTIPILPNNPARQ